jgi:hypothetical protein
MTCSCVGADMGPLGWRFALIGVKVFSLHRESPPHRLKVLASIIPAYPRSSPAKNILQSFDNRVLKSTMPEDLCSEQIIGLVFKVANTLGRLLPA